jgi:hypothetical protein
MIARVALFLSRIGIVGGIALSSRSEDEYLLQPQRGITRRADAFALAQQRIGHENTLGVP